MTGGDSQGPQEFLNFLFVQELGITFANKETVLELNG